MLQIAALSRVNHKNFTNLIGYCDEEEPFTRMMVFEYAPNGNLFEHLHGNNFQHSLKAQVITLRIANLIKGLSSLYKKQNA